MVKCSVASTTCTPKSSRTHSLPKTLSSRASWRARHLEDQESSSHSHKRRVQVRRKRMPQRKTIDKACWTQETACGRKWSTELRMPLSSAETLENQPPSRCSLRTRKLGVYCSQLSKVQPEAIPISQVEEEWPRPRTMIATWTSMEQWKFQRKQLSEEGRVKYNSASSKRKHKELQQVMVQLHLHQLLAREELTSWHQTSRGQPRKTCLHLLDWYMARSKASKTVILKIVLAKTEKHNKTTRISSNNLEQSCLKLSDWHLVLKPQMTRKTLKLDQQNQSNGLVIAPTVCTQVREPCAVWEWTNKQTIPILLASKLHRRATWVLEERSATSAQHQSYSIRATIRKEEIRSLIHSLRK